MSGPGDWYDVTVVGGSHEVETDGYRYRWRERVLRLSIRDHSFESYHATQEWTYGNNHPDLKS